MLPPLANEWRTLLKWQAILFMPLCNRWTFADKNGWWHAIQVVQVGYIYMCMLTAGGEWLSSANKAGAAIKVRVSSSRHRCCICKWQGIKNLIITCRFHWQLWGRIIMFPGAAIYFKNHLMLYYFHFAEMLRDRGGKIPLDCFSKLNRAIKREAAYSIKWHGLNLIYIVYVILVYCQLSNWAIAMHII